MHKYLLPMIVGVGLTVAVAVHAARETGCCPD